MVVLAQQQYTLGKSVVILITICAHSGNKALSWQRDKNKYRAKHSVRTKLSNLMMSTFRKYHIKPNGPYSQSHNPQCTSPIYRNAPFCQRIVHITCVHVSVTYSALWDICLLHRGICETGVLQVWHFLKIACTKFDNYNAYSQKVANGIRWIISSISCINFNCML